MGSQLSTDLKAPYSTSIPCDLCHFALRRHCPCGVADGVLSMSLFVENTGDQASPFGFGFHPWMIRTPDTQLRASDSRVWLEDEQHLRKGTSPVVIPRDWDFQSLASLPDGWINNAFNGWDGTGEVWWPDRDMRL